MSSQAVHTTKFNVAIATDYRDVLGEEWTDFESVGYRLNYDALWKWSSIWHALKELGALRKGIQCVDIGGGFGPLQFIFSTYGRVTNIDRVLKRFFGSRRAAGFQSGETDSTSSRRGSLATGATSPSRELMSYPT